MYYSYVKDINLNSSRKWSASHVRKTYTSVTTFLDDDKSGLGLQGLIYLYGSEIWGKRQVRTIAIHFSNPYKHLYIVKTKSE